MTGPAADVLTVAGLVVMTIGVLGAIRLPDVYTQLHATAKAAFLGVVLLLAAAAAGGDGAIVARTVLIAGLLAVTTPVSAHAIARAARRRGEPMRGPRVRDEDPAGED